MAFFEHPQRGEDPEPPPAPVWAGPPPNVLGAAVPLRLVLVRTSEVAIAVTDASAYPTGLSLTLSLRLREAIRDPRFDPIGHQLMGELRGHGQTGGSSELPPELFRFGVQYADGRKATTVGNPFSADAEPQGPILLPGSGGGGAREWDQSYWLWPLPPAGPLAFVCEWPVHDVALTRAEIDASLILEAAARAETLWDETPSQDEAGGGGVSWRPYGYGAG
jgi:hypothetical protein